MAKVRSLAVGRVDLSLSLDDPSSRKVGVRSCPSSLRAIRPPFTGHAPEPNPDREQNQNRENGRYRNDPKRDEAVVREVQIGVDIHSCGC